MTASELIARAWKVLDMDHYTSNERDKMYLEALRQLNEARGEWFGEPANGWATKDQIQSIQSTARPKGEILIVAGGEGYVVQESWPTLITDTDRLWLKRHGFSPE